MRGRSLNVSAASVLAYTPWLRFTPSKMLSVLKCRTTPISSATLCWQRSGLHDHLVHFYQLAGMDWIDVLDALKADPRKTSELAQSLSSWPKSSPGYFFDVQNRLKKFVEGGQLRSSAMATGGAAVQVAARSQPDGLCPLPRSSRFPA